MLKVTYKSSFKVKEGRKWVEKGSQWDEVIEQSSQFPTIESMKAGAKLRALALNWQIVKMEVV